jgi:hypothetical protein
VNCCDALRSGRPAVVVVTVGEPVVEPLRLVLSLGPMRLLSTEATIDRARPAMLRSTD